LQALVFPMTRWQGFFEVVFILLRTVFTLALTGTAIDHEKGCCSSLLSKAGPIARLVTHHRCDLFNGTITGIHSQIRELGALPHLGSCGGQRQRYEI
jgi:hypothetical protein